MGQYSMNAYDADIYIRQFKGLISNGNDPDGNLEYAVEAENVDTTDGFLQPAADPAVAYIDENKEKSIDELLLDITGYYWEQQFSGKTEIEINALTLKFLQYYTGDTKKINEEGYKSKLRHVIKMNVEFPVETALGYKYVPGEIDIFTSGNGFFFTVSAPDNYLGGTDRCEPLPVTALYKMDGTIDDTFYEGWDMEYPPGYRDLGWSAAIYQGKQTTEEGERPKPGPGGQIHGSGGGTITYTFCDNALYLSNKENGLYCIQAFLKKMNIGGTKPIVQVECYKIETPANFECIETFGERLWGCCSIQDKETVFYSTPYNPFDWQQNNDQPADGAGQINEPNWDGDFFTGLKPFGNALFAFKKHRVWKLNGVDLGTMVITEQYGFGTEFINTVVSSGERLYFANRNGLAIFDGSTVRPLMQDNLRNLWSRVRQSAMDKMRAFLYENRKYCLAVPVNSDENNTLIVYDTIDGTVFFYEDMNIICFRHPIKAQEPIVLWRGETRSNLKRFDFNAWEKNLSGSRATKWMTPWIELGRKDIQKGGHDFYFTPEVKGENAVTFTISFQTEKKTKTKQYTVQPMTAVEIAAGKQGKTKRLHFGGTGRRFRIIIETPSGVDAGKAYKWRLYGGIHLITEIDKD